MTEKVASQKSETSNVSVFIGWSGTQSQAVAEALHGWLPRVIQTVRPFMSEIDIPSGTKWQETLDDEIRKARFGILCLTPENKERPWVLFEAGALSALKGRQVCPYLFGLSNTDLSGPPLTVFQSNSANHDGTFKLVKAVNALLSYAAGQIGTLGNLRLMVAQVREEAEGGTHPKDASAWAQRTRNA